MSQTQQRRVCATSRWGIALILAVVGSFSCANSNPAATQPDDTVIDDALDGMVSLELADFDSVIAASTPYALVKFYLSMCAACAQIAPMADSLAATYKAALYFYKVNVDDDDILWKRYEVATVPTFLLFHHGEVVARKRFTTISAAAYDTLAALVETALAGGFADPAYATSLPAVVVELTADNFSSLILQSNGLAAVYFYLPNCMACMVMDDSVKFLAERFAGRALVGKIHASENLSITRQFEVERVPALVFFKNGREYARFETGLSATVDTLAALLEEGLAESEETGGSP